MYVNLGFYLSHSLVLIVFLWHVSSSSCWLVEEHVRGTNLCNTESFRHMDKTCLCVLVIFVLWYGVSQVRNPQQSSTDLSGKSRPENQEFFVMFPFTDATNLAARYQPVLTGHSCPEISHYCSTVLLL